MLTGLGASEATHDPLGSRRSRRRQILGVLILMVAVPPAVLSVAGFFGAWSWALDLAAAFRPQYAVVLAGLAAGVGLLGRRGSAAVLGVLAIVNAVLVAPLWLSAPEPAAHTATLRVLFHNVHGGGDDRFERVAAALERSDADVVFLSEMSARWIDLFAATDLPYSVVHPLDVTDHRRIIALSRVPVRAVEPVLLVEASRSGGIAVEVLLDGRPVRILGLHTQSPRDARSSALRDDELAAAGDWVSQQRGPVVVVGDLNATPWSRAFRALRRDTGLRDSHLGFGLQPTWMTGTGPFMIPIDHALHDPTLTVVERTTGPSLDSTHYSLTARFAWRADAAAAAANVPTPAGDF